MAQASANQALRAPGQQPLDSVGDVLRYWSTLLKYQEALAARPRARRVPETEGPPNLLEPVAGQEYLKLGLAGAEPFLIERGSLPPLGLDAERRQFFEDWLANQYRRGDDDQDSLAHLALFPVVHLPRDELAGVLRFPVELEWYSGAQRFTAPRFEDRTRGRFPEPPSELRLRHPAKDPEQTLPFFVDTSLLRRTLKVDAEDVEAFFARLRRVPDLTPRRMVAEVCALLETPLDVESDAQGAAAKPQGSAATTATESSAAALLGRLHHAVVVRLARLNSRSRAYPVALVVSVNRSRATWHVQRDLEEAARQLGEGRLERQSPLAGYLYGRSATLPAGLCLGRWPDAPLTFSQKQALEQALGARLSAVQGPPGTGKTTLILNAVVHQLIEKMAPVADGQPASDAVLIVTSTNNRAVDNVMEPLCAGPLSDCPLALRLGNREVMANATLSALERLQAWLVQATAPDAAEWAQIKLRFSICYARVDAALKPLRDIQAQKHELAALERSRSTLLPEADADSDGPPPFTAVELALSALGSSGTRGSTKPALWREHPEAARAEVGRLIQSLAKLSRSCEADGDALPEVERGAARLKKRRLAPLKRALGVEIVLELPTPSAAPKPDVEAWEEAIERLVSKLLDLESALGRFALHSEREATTLDVESRIAELTRRLGSAAEPCVGVGTGQASDSERAPLVELEMSIDRALRDDFVELYAAALAMRSAWMLLNRTEIDESLRAAIALCKRTRSLRSLFQHQGKSGLWLRRVFPSFGCTLLSLGNAFPADEPSLSRVIVDEAGQCHSAYAISALLRARSALIIGDVHQLEPVIGLGEDDERRIRKGLKLRMSEAEIEPYRVYDESGHSAQSLADRAVPGRPTLIDHFRCQPGIVALCEAWCGYGMSVHTSPSSLAHLVPELVGPVLFLPVAGEQRRFAGSFQNVEELEQIVAWLQRLLARGVPPSDLAVITPYRGQFEAVFRRLRAEGLPLERGAEDAESEQPALFSRGGGLAIGTVHRFQGGERRVVLLSTTLTRPSSLGFLNDRVHLLNVAASRAKQHLIVVGHESTLRAGVRTRVLIDGHPRLPSL